jgi:hypothetical protein
MEIYKAAELYSEHLEILDIADRLDENCWEIVRSSDKESWLVCMTIALTVRMPYISDLEERIDGTFITKQRGGMRRFRTLDAAVRAVEQIGQEDVNVVLGC